MFREKNPLYYARPSSNKEIVGREDQPQIVQRRASGQPRHCADRLVIVVISIKVSNHQLPQYHPTLKLTLSLGKCLYFSSDSTESFSCHMDSSISKSISLSLWHTHRTTLNQLTSPRGKDIFTNFRIRCHCVNSSGLGLPLLWAFVDTAKHDWKPGCTWGRSILPSSPPHNFHLVPLTWGCDTSVYHLVADPWTMSSALLFDFGSFDHNDKRFACLPPLVELVEVIMHGRTVAFP